MADQNLRWIVKLVAPAGNEMKKQPPCCGVRCLSLERRPKSVHESIMRQTASTSTTSLPELSDGKYIISGSWILIVRNAGWVVDRTNRRQKEIKLTGKRREGKGFVYAGTVDTLDTLAGDAIEMCFAASQDRGRRGRNAIYCTAPNHPAPYPGVMRSCER
jgi:hypothetical protein